MEPSREENPTPTAREGGGEGSEAGLLLASLEVFRHLDLTEQLRAIAGYAAEWTGASAIVAFALDGEGQGLIPVSSEAPPPVPREGTDPKLDLAKVRSWVERGEPAAEVASLMEGVSALPELASAGPILTLTVRSEKKDIAGLVVVAGPGILGEGGGRAKRFVDMVRPAIANALQVRAMGELVIKDDTVECFNRRHFEEFLSEELARATRFRAPLSLIFFDMDNLKQVNSDLGHSMGSRTLYEVALRVRGKIRRFDKLFRFGGDEFCIVLPETEWHGALEVAERVREAISGRQFLLEERGPSGGIRMTASFGIASFPLHARTKADLLERADRAMQRVKVSAKNSIAISEIVEEEHGP